MKKLLALEEAGQFLITLIAYFHLDNPLPWGWLILALFTPDLFAAGYLINNRVGAVLYNLSHHKLTAVILAGAGWMLSEPAMLHAGLIVFMHSCLDRTLGYGLKYMSQPGHTHLGFIGKERGKNPPDHF